ncbi:MAG: Protein kinase protein, partial [Anaerolineales bacterium]|nr:Protein kinase protein [Anaerolineales bacterium]
AEEKREAHALRLAALRRRRRERLWVVAGMAIVVLSLSAFAVGARADIAHWAGPMLRQAGLLAPGLPAAPPAGISSVGFPTATRTLVPTSSPGTTLPRTVTSIPSPTPIPVAADVRNGIAWRPYASWTWDEPSLIFSMAPDGETAVVVSGESIDLVDPVTGEVKQSLPPFLVGRTAYAVAQRGSTILVGVEVEIQRFDLRSNNPLTPLPIPGRELRLSPSGNLLAVRDKYITFLNLETGNRLAGLGETNADQPFAISPNDRTLALAEGVAVALWDLEKGVSEGRLEGHGEPVEGLAFTREGNRLVSASGDVWDLATGELTAVFDSATDQIVLSPNGQLIIGSDGSVWDLATGELIGKIPFEKGTPGTLLFTSDGRFLIRTVGVQAQVWVADPGAASRTAQGPAVEEIEGEPISDLNLYRLVRGEPLDHDGYGGFDVRPDGRAAAAWHGRTVRVFDLQDEAPLAEFALEGTVTDAAFLGDDFLVVVVNETRTERWEVSSGRALQTYAVGGGQIETSPAGDTFAVRAKYIQVVDALSGGIVNRLGSADASQDFEFTPDGRHLLIAAGPGVGVWDVESGRLTQQLAGHGDTVIGLRVTPDGRRAAAASGDVWDLEEARLLASFGTTAG